MAAGLIDWRVRHAEIEDARSIAGIQVAGWRAAYQGIVPEEHLAGRAVNPERIEQCRRYVSAPAPSGVFVAVDEQDAIGAFCAVGTMRTVHGGTEPDAGELRAIYADPDRQGSGAGGAVHDAAVEYLRQQGFRWAGLWVFTANASARAFYAARGWAPVGEVHGLEISGMTIPEMRYTRIL